MRHAGPIVVLGAGGFIGRALVARLATRETPVRAISRSEITAPPGVELFVTGTLGPQTPWASLLDGADAIIHLASRAHAPPGDESWIAVEEQAAAQLAQAARQAGVRRLIFMSSIKAMGEASGDRPFRAEDPAAPGDIYGRAKLRLETALQAAPELVILRPPLVYGPGVKGNFRALLRVVTRGIPLPLASIRNRRSFVYIDNLLDLIELALVHDAAAGAVFLLRDAEEVSTPELFRRVGYHLERAARLLPCPPRWLQLAAHLAGRDSQASALLGSLSIDDAPTRTRLGWQPRVSLDDGLAETCRWFRNLPQ